LFLIPYLSFFVLESIKNTKETKERNQKSSKRRGIPEDVLVVVGGETKRIC